ncbi:MAG: non-ribosomal peptide synthetase, partial [bacterium]|nr:non-ribosomal peptide synthetase [bacterium]
GGRLNAELPVSAELKGFLAGILPDYMIPSFFVPLEELPLSLSGKMNRLLLPEPGIRSGREYVAPRDGIEKKLVELWSVVLGVEKDKIGIDDNFFELGGHSLKGMMLSSKIHRELKVNLSLGDIFKFPVIRKLSKCIKEASEDEFLSIEAVEKSEYYKLSSAQKRFYVLAQMNFTGTDYNMPMCYQLEDPDIQRLEAVFRQLIRRHETFRTFFIVVNEEPVQKILDIVEFEIETLPSSTGLDDFIRPFDLREAPLLRVGLIDRGDRNYLLMIDMHHIISDGGSMGLFLQEVLALYRGEALNVLKLQYKDFARWQHNLVNSGEMEKQEAFWLERFRGEAPVLKLPADNPRSALKTGRSGSADSKIPEEHAAKLRTLAKRENATMYIVMLAVFNILLYKLTRREDIVVGTPVDGRRHPDLENIIGIFINTLVPRNYPQKEISFLEFLGEVKTGMLGAFDNQDYQFEELVEKLDVPREPGRNPLFEVLFLFNETDMTKSSQRETEAEAAGLKVEPYNLQTRQAKFDILFTGRDTGEDMSV